MNQGYTDPVQQKISAWKSARFWGKVFAAVTAAVVTLSVFSVAVDAFLPTKQVTVQWQGRKYSLKEFVSKVEPEIRRELNRMDSQRAKPYEEWLKAFDEKFSYYYPHFPFLGYLFKRYPYEGAGLKVVYFLLVLLISGGAYLIYRRYNKLRELAFQLPVIEPPIDLGKPEKFFYWELLKFEDENGRRRSVTEEEVVERLFRSREHYNEVLSVFDAQLVADERTLYFPEKREAGKVYLPVKEINEDCERFAREVVEFGRRRTLKGMDAEKLNDALLRYFFVLTHHSLRQFGNVPTGYLNSRLKDDVLKRVLNAMPRKKVILLDSDPLECEKEAEALTLNYYLFARRQEKRKDTGGLEPLDWLKDKYKQVPPTNFDELRSAGGE